MHLTYFPPMREIGDVERWALDRAYDLIAVERGPDGLLRGIARRNTPSHASVIANVARLTGVARADILGQSRRARFTPARLSCYWAMRQLGMSYPEIARAMCRRNHTTILKQIRKATMGNKKIGAMALREAR